MVWRSDRGLFAWHTFLVPVASICCIWLPAISFAAGAADGAEGLPERVEFNRDIRSILAENCFACHGPDGNKRQADLRLDLESSARANRDNGAAVVPGDAESSLLLQRVMSDNEFERMPPPATGKSLTPRQTELLRRWIAQGASWEQHWSFIPPRRYDPPEVRDQAWVQNPIDRFVLAKLESLQWAPARDADKRTLARRLFFDLTGLPPAPEQVDAFLADSAATAYEQLVDSLLRSEHFGERMAGYWLDVVRYADTAGYHSDNHRDLFLYRDYVIQAFNNDKPFDQFCREQLAGDLIPNATNEQRIASGFNRLLQTTEEGGAQPKEYTAKYAADRVRNTSVIFLGLTMGCCECHNHKYDPLTARDFYSMQAFFADVTETPVGRQAQTPIPLPNQERQIAELDEQLAQLRGELYRPSEELRLTQEEWDAAHRAAIQAGRSHWQILKPESLTSGGGVQLNVLEDLSVLASEANPDKDVYTVVLRPGAGTITGLRLEALTHDSFPNKGLSRAGGNFVLTGVELESKLATADKPEPVKLVSAAADFSQDSFPVAHAIDGKPDTGWAVNGHVQPADRKASFGFEKPLTLAEDTLLTLRLRFESPHAQHTIGRFRIALTSLTPPALSDSGLPEEIASIVAMEPAARSEEQRAKLFRHYRETVPSLAGLRQQIAERVGQREAIVKAFPQTLVTVSMAPRTVRILPRGNWLDESGEIVEPATPEVFGKLEVPGRRPDRLDLARWLTGPENPLLARVFVNRVWKLMFGQGIVRSVEDFGTQGELPTHPELLDWLALDFRENGWSVKRLVKQMVMSRTYRQLSLVEPAMRELDPHNRWLARQSRYRLEAESIRDSALAISGLLSRKLGGPSVKPYQPAGYWAHLNFPTREWQNDHGEDLYRRGLYTYWCRTFLNPSLLAFDAPSREECTADRPRSNTPLQALVLLNDPTYLEAARSLAERALLHAGKSTAERIRYLFRQTLQREPRELERATLSELVENHLQSYQQNRSAAEKVAAVGERPKPADLDAVEYAAWTSAARVLLNLHETITRN
jgi:mono/diheme cytochrome c family protein